MIKVSLVLMCSLACTAVPIRSAFAGSGSIFVSSTNSCSERKDYPRNVPVNDETSEDPIFLLTPHELIASYKLFFEHQPTKFSGILNGGAVYYCSTKDQRTVHEFLLTLLKTPKPEQVVWEALVQQYRSATLQSLVNEEISRASDGHYKKNLDHLKKLILEHRSMPSMPADIQLHREQR